MSDAIELTESEKKVCQVANYSVLQGIPYEQIHQIIWFCFQAGRDYQREFGDRKVAEPFDPFESVDE
jgi:hypothetical protein